MNIVTELKKIMQAVYGEEVRGSIHDAILKCWGNSDATLRKVENAQKKAAASAESAISSEQNAQAAKDATQQLANTIEDKISNGYFKGRKRRVGNDNTYKWIYQSGS